MAYKAVFKVLERRPLQGMGGMLTGGRMPPPFSAASLFCDPDLMGMTGRDNEGGRRLGGPEPGAGAIYHSAERGARRRAAV